MGQNFEHRDALIAHLKQLEADGMSEAIEPSLEHSLYLSDTVGTDRGRFHLTEDNIEAGVFHFEITLGPVNARKLIEFVQSLPDEPGFEDED